MKPDKQKIGNIVSQIKKHKDAIAKHRDELRDLYAELEDIVESTDRGLLDLEDAIDSLSQYL